jgi:hypothetical protein
VSWLNPATQVDQFRLFVRDEKAVRKKRALITAAICFCRAECSPSFQYFHAHPPSVAGSFVLSPLTRGLGSILKPGSRNRASETVLKTRQKTYESRI